MFIDAFVLTTTSTATAGSRVGIERDDDQQISRR